MKAHHLVLLIPCAVVAACTKTPSLPPPPPTPAATAEPAATATAQLQGASGSMVTGELNFAAGTGGVSVMGHVAGLMANTIHGFHVHEVGDCSAPDAKTAGEHFNPEHANHGGPTADDRHLGDLPNIETDGTGNATVSATISNATLRDGGSHDLVGKAVIVHAKRDDYVTQPSGDSGDRIACGVVR